MENQKRKLRIAMVVYAFPALSQTFIVNQITGLIDLGHEIDIFSFIKLKENQIANDIHKYNLLSKVTYLKGISKDFSKTILRFLKLFFRFIFIYPKEILKVLNIFQYKSMRIVLNNFFILSYFLGKNYDVFHCHFGLVGKELVFVKEIMPQVKIITQFHGYDISKYIKENGEQTYDELFRKGDHFLPVSEHFKNRLLQLGCPQEKITIHYCGVYLDRFPWCEHKFDFGQRIQILSLGRLAEKKGVEYMIKAVAHLRFKFPQLQCEIVGDGEERTKLEELVEQNDLERMIQFKGSVTTGEVQQYFQRADIFIAPSVTSSSGDEEGLVVTIKEAMATGTPVITTNHAEIPEMVTDGISGFLVSERNAQEIADRITSLVLNPDLCRTFASGARKVVEQKFDQLKLNEQLEEIYFNVSSR